VRTHTHALKHTQELKKCRLLSDLQKTAGRRQKADLITLGIYFEAYRTSLKLPAGVDKNRVGQNHVCMVYIR
jgi:hypothetical protein